MEKNKLLPKELITSNGEFDLIDPKLSETWQGRIFLHPPHNANFEKYIDKMANHGNGIALVFSRTDSNAFHKYILNRAHALFFISGRFKYIDENGKKFKENCGGAVLFVAYGQQNSSILKQCKIKGVYVPLVRKYTRKRIEKTEKIDL